MRLGPICNEVSLAGRIAGSTVRVLDERPLRSAVTTRHEVFKTRTGNLRNPSVVCRAY